MQECLHFDVITSDYFFFLTKLRIQTYYYSRNKSFGADDAYLQSWRPAAQEEEESFWVTPNGSSI